MQSSLRASSAQYVGFGARPSLRFAALTHLPPAQEIQNHVVNALFNLCRLSKVRQEEAAIAGAIPILQRVVSGSSPLKQFALPILCDFAHASKSCRKLYAISLNLTRRRS